MSDQATITSERTRRTSGAIATAPRTRRSSLGEDSTGGGTAPEYAAEYATFFAPRTHKFETVDFRVAASRVNLDKYFPKTARERRRSNQLAAALGVLVGVVIGMCGFFVDQLLRGITIAIYVPTNKFLALRTRDSFFAAVCAYALLCSAAVILAALLVVLIAPLGAGSGIPELKAYLNGVHVPGFLRFKTLMVKAIGVALSIGGGLICGKQGPLIHVGAIIGAGMSQGASAQFKFRLSHPFRNTLRFLRTNAWKRDFSAVGAAIGVAVAFGAPMGGWVWVYEEACTHWSWALGLITLGGCLSGVVTVGFMNYLAAGMPNGGFKHYVLTYFGRLYFPKSTMEFPLTDLPMYIVIGIIGGVVGVILPAINKLITLFRYKRITLRANRVVEALVIAILTAVLRISIPKLANSCIPVNQSFTESLRGEFDYSQFNCPNGQFSIWAATFYNPTSSIVRALLYADDVDLFPAIPLVIAIFLFFFFIIWTYGVAVPAGVFFPGFVLGCVYGRLCGVLVQTIFPSKTDVSMTAYAFLGAVSALAGITRTISVAIIALEATAKGEAFFGAIVVALVAKVVADKLYRLGIYDLHIELKGMPYLTEFVPDLASYNLVRIRSIMERNVVGVRRHSKVCEIVHVLRTTTHHSFPVFLKLRGLKRQGYVLDGEGELQKDSSSESSPIGPNLAEEKTSSIITPTPDGMQATRFGTNSVSVVKLGQRGRVELVKAIPTTSPDNGVEKSEHSTYSETEEVATTPRRNLRLRNNATSAERGSPDRELPGGLQPNTSGTTPGDSLGEVQDFGLSGMITRDVLLAVLEKLLDMKDEDAEDVNSRQVHRNLLDSAWPNSARYKREEDILECIEQTPLQDFVVDLEPYIDPDPLLISGRALTTAGYRLLRNTGARHMLVTNMQSGRVVGIVTRKDILPESINEHLTRVSEVKVL